MPNPVNNPRAERWARCQRCGRLYPESALTKQKGLLVGPGCVDNLDVEIRQKQIQEVLSSPEGVPSQPVVETPSDEVFL